MKPSNILKQDITIYLFLLGAWVLFTLAFVSEANAYRNTNPPPEESITCDSIPTEVRGKVALLGCPLYHSTIAIDATTVKIYDASGNYISSLPQGGFSWEIINKPSESTTQLDGVNSQQPTLYIDKSGNYSVRFTACPGSNGCELSVVNNRDITYCNCKYTYSILGYRIYSRRSLPSRNKTARYGDIKYPISK